jgi:hypothetical protein
MAVLSLLSSTYKNMRAVCVFFFCTAGKMTIPESPGTLDELPADVDVSLPFYRRLAVIVQRKLRAPLHRASLIQHLCTHRKGPLQSTLRAIDQLFFRATAPQFSLVDKDNPIPRFRDTLRHLLVLVKNDQSIALIHCLLLVLDLQSQSIDKLHSDILQPRHRLYYQRLRETYPHPPAQIARLLNCVHYLVYHLKCPPVPAAGLVGRPASQADIDRALCCLSPELTASVQSLQDAALLDARGAARVRARPDSSRL